MLLKIERKLSENLIVHPYKYIVSATKNKPINY